MVLSDDFYYQPIRLDTINTQIYTDLIAKEGDAGGRGLKVTITENGVTKNTTGITLNLKWEHTAVADLQGLEPFEAVDLTKGIYKLKYPTNMLQKGTVKALIQIIDNGGLAGSRNLKIKVDSTVGDDTAMESSNEFTALVTALVKTNHMENLLNETIANVTVDSEVITARNSTAKQKTFTVLDERMEDLEKDVYYPANNELTQADFAATTGWSVYQGTLAVANNVASVTGTSGLYPNVYQDINCEVGDKLYYAAQARVTTAGATAIALRSEGVEITTDNARVLAPVANQWYQLDCIKTAFETTPSFAVSQRYALAADATGKVLQVKKPIALNLTKIFGANAIPTIEQIRAILSRFTDSHFVGNEGLSQPALLMGKALSLEAQFNAAVAGLTVDDETINARVGKDNTTHATLKARLDSEKSTTDQSLVSLGQQLEQNTKKLPVFSFTGDKNEYLPSLTKSPNNPVFSNMMNSSYFTSVYWPWIVRMDHLETPLGQYYLFYSTDHDATVGGIGMAYGDDPKGPWTDYGLVFVDPLYPQAETPSVMWNESLNKYQMFYHVASGIGRHQTTTYATSDDCITWTASGAIVVDPPANTEYPGDGHTGYFRPFKMSGMWHAYHLMGGKDYGHFGISHSYDGVEWMIDPRPLYSGFDMTRNIEKQIAWNMSHVINWRGRLYWIGYVATIASGTSEKVAEVSIAPLNDDMRSFASPAVPLITVTEPWETTNLRSVFAFVEDEKLYIYYQSDNNIGVAYTE